MNLIEQKKLRRAPVLRLLTRYAALQRGRKGPLMRDCPMKIRFGRTAFLDRTGEFFEPGEAFEFIAVAELCRVKRAP